MKRDGIIFNNFTCIVIKNIISVTSYNCVLHSGAFFYHISLDITYWLLYQRSESSNSPIFKIIEQK
jgi:hypothetical protein